MRKTNVWMEIATVRAGDYCMSGQKSKRQSEAAYSEAADCNGKHHNLFGLAHRHAIQVNCLGIDHFSKSTLIALAEKGISLPGDS
jgi:hypothetical protein